MKSKLNRFLATSVTTVLALSSSAFAADRFKQNNLTNVDLPASWDTLPTSADVAVFDATYATTGVLTTTSLLSWSGIRIASPGGKVIIDSAAGFNVGLGAAGIDMASATRDLSIERFQFNASQTWNIAAAQSFTIGRSTAPRVGVFVNNAAGSTITKTGAGAVNLDMANVTLGNVNWDVQAGVVRAIWSNASAFGTSTITLGGGGLATGTPFTGSVGNWTWNNNITLTAATNSFFDNQNISGADRSLGLSGAITGDGSLTFNNTAADAGFVYNLSGTNGYTGGTTVTGGTLLFASAAALPATGIITVNGNGAVGGLAYPTVQDWLNSGRISTASTGAVAIAANSANAIDFSAGGYNSLGLASSGAFTYSGVLTPGTGGYIFGGGKNLTVTSALSAATTLTKNGGAVTIINSDANGYTGVTTVNGGELQALTTTAGGAKTPLGSAAINVNPGSTLRFKTAGTTNAQSYANPINLSGATLISEDGIVTFGGAIGLTGANTINVVYANKSAEFTSPITGTGSFTKIGPGPMILTAAGSSVASLTVNQGKISVGATGSLTVVGQYRTSATSAKGSLDIAAGGVVNADSIFSSWGTDLLVDGALNVTGAFTFSGGTSTVTGSGTIKAGTLAHANFGTDNLNGTRFNIGAGGITFTQAGALNLGATTLGAFADWSSTAPMTLTAVTTVNTLDAMDNSTPRSIILTGVLSGAGGGLTKTGSGTLTLDGLNTYGGDTTVSGGLLAVNGSSIPDGGKLVINAGGKVASSAPETVSSLYFGAAQQAAGTWGAAGSGASHIDDVHFSGTSVINVTTGAGGGYAGFATTNAPGQTAGQDYDNDGVSNGVEYILGGLASTQDAGKLPTASVSGGNLVFTFKRTQASKTADVSVAIEVGTTLVTWPTSYTVGNDTASSSPGVTVTPNGDGTDSVTLTVAQAPDAKKFARLVVKIN